jgi:ABC-2 type transport system ATP-binding protein
MADSSIPVVIDGLTKRLGRGVLAVDGLDLVVQPGQVVGLAGPNGAGKSVTLKILLGLVRPTSGRVEVFGEHVRPGAKVLGRVGALVDGPGFVPHLSGRENLRLAWRMMRGSERVSGLDRAIEITGLGQAIDRPFKTYSHGMRYRLGLAQALLGAPELLLLDEPTTGLDPAHIREIREAISNAAAHGTTVVFSSHLLSEVERICTHAAVMRAGRLIASGPVAELMGSAADLQFDVDEPERASKLLGDVAGVVSATPGAGCVLAQGSSLKPAELLLVLDEASLRVRGFRRGRSLEDAYLRLVCSEAPVDGAGSRSRTGVER